MPTRLAFLIAVCSLCTGCIGFSGPEDVRRAILASEPVHLEKEQGISVGPLAMGFVSLVAGPYLPPGATAVSSVDYGLYRVEPLSADPGACLRLCRLELDGWVPIARIRERGEEIIVMVDDGERLRRLLVLQREDDELQIIKVHADFERIIDAMFESGWIDLGDFGGLDGLDSLDECAADRD